MTSEGSPCLLWVTNLMLLPITLWPHRSPQACDDQEVLGIQQAAQWPSGVLEEVESPGGGRVCASGIIAGHHAREDMFCAQRADAVPAGILAI